MYTCAPRPLDSHRMVLAAKLLIGQSHLTEPHDGSDAKRSLRGSSSLGVLAFDYPTLCKQVSYSRAPFGSARFLSFCMFLLTTV